MKIVEPIRDIKDIELIKKLLKSEWKIRDLLLFEMWINSALRISDLLKITVGDVFDDNRNVKDDFRVKEQKTNKNGQIFITPKVKETLKLYKATYPFIIKNNANHLFFRQKKFKSRDEALGDKPISACMARRLVSWWCHRINLKWSYWCHSMRKCWGYQARQQNVDMSLIQHRLNHSSLSVTKRYLWITDNELRDMCEKLNL